MAACDGPRCGPHHHALPCARSLPAWCVLAYVSVREKKPHVGEHRNVLVVRNLRIIRKYDANTLDRVLAVSQKSVQYSYIVQGGDAHECIIRVLQIRFCVLWMEIRVFVECKISYCWKAHFKKKRDILSQYSLVFGEKKLSKKKKKFWDSFVKCVVLADICSQIRKKIKIKIHKKKFKNYYCYFFLIIKVKKFNTIFCFCCVLANFHQKTIIAYESSMEISNFINLLGWLNFIQVGYES